MRKGRSNPFKVPRQDTLRELLRMPEVWPREGERDPIAFACRTASRSIELVWSASNPHAARVAELRRLQAKWAADAEAAKDTAARLLNMAPRDWRAYIAAHRTEMTTAVIDLILEAAAAIDLPIRMHELTSLATEVAANISDAEEHQVALVRSLARAWRFHASALEGLTRYEDALAACIKAESHIVKVPALCEDRAAIAHVRAVIHMRLKHYDDGIRLAEEASGVYSDLGDKQRFVKTRTLLGALLYESGRNDEALDLWKSLIAEAEAIDERETLAFLHLNIGVELRGRSDFDRASWHLRAAVRMFSTLKMTSQIPRARLGLVRIKLIREDYSKAIPELWKVFHEFAGLGMNLAAACRLVEICEAHLRLDQEEEAYEACSELMRFASEMHLPTGALDAGQFLRQCADMGDLKLTDLQYVGLFLKDLPQNPLSAFSRPRRAGRL